MNIRHDVEHLRRRIGRIEFDLEDTRRRLALLEATLEAAEPEAPKEQAADIPRHQEPCREKRTPCPPPLPASVFQLKEEIRERTRTIEPAPGVRDEGGKTREDEDLSGAGGSGLKTWLQRLQLWPPDDGGNSEARLGAWWATRIGTLLAVIGVVFFGAYVSLNTPAWVKFAELCAICGGVAASGLWLEKRIPRFGAVVFAGGLALVYFCAFAAYALPAVKVVTSPLAAAGWQLAAVCVIAAASVGRRSSSIATMAVGLGYATAIFSGAGGLHAFALVTAAMLAGATIVFQRRLKWEGPSVVAMPASYAVYALVLHGNWREIGATTAAWPWLYLLGMAVLFFARDWRAVRVSDRDVGMGERWFQGTNSTLATGLGVITGLALYREELAVFYFVAAAVLGVFAALRRAQVENDTIGSVLIAKASGAVTLGVIELVDGRTTALALLVQAWVMLLSARRLRSRVLQAGAGVVAIAATGFFFSQKIQAMPMVSWDAAGALAFVIGIAWLASEARRTLSERIREAGVALDVIGAFVAAMAAMVTAHQLRPDGWEPAVLAGVAVFLATGVRLRGGAAPLIAAGCVLAAANANLWILVENPALRDLWLVNSIAVLAPGVLLSVRLGGEALRARTNHAIMSVYATLVGVVTLVGIIHLVFALLAPEAAWAITSLLALTLGVLAGFWRERDLSWLATVCAVLGYVFWRKSGANAGEPIWFLVTLIAAWALPVLLNGSRRHAEALKKEPAAEWLTALQMVAAVWITWEALPLWFHATDESLALAYALMALASYGLTRWPRIAVGLETSWAMWAFAIWKVLSSVHGAYATNEILLCTVALLAWAAVVMVSLESAGETRAWWRRPAVGVQTTIATTLTFVVCVRCFEWEELPLALLAATAIAAGVFRWRNAFPVRRAAVVLAVTALAAACVQVDSGYADGARRGLAIMLAVAGGAVSLPLVTRMGFVGRWIFGGAGLGLAFWAALAQHGALAPYATVGWGIASIAVFMTGVFARTRPYRMLGLIGLGLCVARVFMVDLDSALHRIVAFVVLGLVLLWVGFSYHRYRHLIGD